MVRICSHALATTVVGSSRTPSTPRLLSTRTTYSGSIRQRSAMKPCDLLDAALGVAAVGAHVPLAHRAVRARHRVGPAHDAHDVLADRQPGGPGVDHPPQRLVTEDQPLLTRRRPAVVAARDLGIGAADADGQRLDDEPIRARHSGSGDIVEPADPGAGHHRHCLHALVHRA